MNFSYHDTEVCHISYLKELGPPDATPEEKEALWNAEEPEEVYPEEMPEEERKKRDDEKAKKVHEESEEVNTVAKRKGYKILVHGANFCQSDQMALRFSLENFAPVLVRPVFKNSKLLGAVIPHMGDEVPIGHTPLFVELTLNG